MIGRSVIVCALLAYALVLGCVIWKPAAAPAARENAANPEPGNAGAPALSASREGLPYICVGMQIQRLDWIDKYKKSLDEIADLGADTVKFVVDTRQENGASARIYLDLRMTPTVEQLTDLIKYAKSKKLRVILMPIVLLDRPRGGEWRGKIAPTTDNGGWEEWFDSYRDMVSHFAYIAQANGVDVFVIGSELVSTEDKTDQWVRTIRAVRKIYKGRLTYSSNWDHYTSIHFWDQLDLIGMNSYWKFGKERGFPERPSVEQIQERWSQIQKDLLKFVKQENKPLLFLEIGWFSQANVAFEPWDYTKSLDEAPLDVELQRRLYEGFFRSWWGNPHLGGFSIWEWTPGDGGTEDPGYTPENKPAEQVLREWFAKPRWQVK